LLLKGHILEHEVANEKELKKIQKDAKSLVDSETKKALSQGEFDLSTL
jgi:TPP-dependent pyruvate/acetoin dehydrogenase alpha subunit